MANITESNHWSETIYEIATTDDVIGGKDGINNIQANQLASRTNFLNEHVTQLRTQLETQVDDFKTGRQAVGQAFKLTTARTIQISGDVNGAASFDGASDVILDLVQKSSGVQAGQYRQVTVDAQGRVIDGANPTTLSGYGITDAASLHYVQSTYQPLLGYTPVQQSGGVNQTDHKVQLGWSDEAKFKVSVDYTDAGNVAFEAWVLGLGYADAIQGVTLAANAAQATANYASLPAGTRLPFAQKAAPVGWTQINDDSTNNRMLRVVNGSEAGWGGTHSPVLNNVVPAHTHSFTTGPISADHTHVVQDPGHSHSVRDPGHIHPIPVRARNASGAGVGDSGDGVTHTSSTQAAATGIALHQATTGIQLSGVTSNHTHSGATDNGSSQTNWQPRYIDMIICEKN